MKTVGEMIKSEREKKSMTQVELANILGLHPQNINNWERNRANVPMKHIGKLSKALNLSQEKAKKTFAKNYNEKLRRLLKTYNEKLQTL